MGNPDAEDKLGRPWESGIFKETTEAPVFLSKSGLQGDDVADKKNHGGPEKAVFAYAAKHYDAWQRELDVDITAGGNGENLSVLNMDESSVCLGDTYKLGEAVIQVSQPRRPCWKPARRHKILDFALRIQKTGRTGWYFRVIREGMIRVGDTFELIERPHPEWPIRAANEVMYEQKDNMSLAESLAAVELLADNWKQTLNKRLLGNEGNSGKRIYGPNR
ncbi:MOSC domain-containing protein [Salinicoccus albus]|uniref:MOSC domain-containing protein n=1 Tax=Salinicoccus albus TaxID=418756 RepID=UPI00036D208B|nr:MOSC domain-containing protein [Salinicoccus albus]